MNAQARPHEHPLETQHHAVTESRTATLRPGPGLRIYLQDHHAAAAAGVALARGVLGAHPLADAITRDRETLEEVMRLVAVDRSRVKISLAHTLARLGRLKPNGRARGRTPLASLLELETLVVGIRGKRALWVALHDLGLRELGNVPLMELAGAAEAQEAAVEELRVSAARRALTVAARGST